MERYLKKKQIRKEFPTLFYYIRKHGDLIYFQHLKKSATNFFRQIVCKKQLSPLLGRYDLYGR